MLHRDAGYGNRRCPNTFRNCQGNAVTVSRTGCGPTETVARRIVWFESPAEALADPVRFVAYAAARATHEDMKVVQRYVNDADLASRTPTPVSRASGNAA
jgi:hypothetical protein